MCIDYGTQEPRMTFTVEVFLFVLRFRGQRYGEDGEEDAGTKIFGISVPKNKESYTDEKNLGRAKLL